jgi:glycosyltransferase involved in cell wall biosynthesis
MLMHAADLFVLGSHREGGNTSLIEALATGLPPVVTDISSSRSLLGHGAAGFLWRPGDARSLGDALVRAAAAIGPETRARARAHFDSHLSSSALGRELAAAYRRIAAPLPITADGVPA